LLLFWWLGSENMDAIAHLTIVPCFIDNSDDNEVITESVLASSWIFRSFYLILFIYPEISHTSLCIIGTLSSEVNRTSHSITIELILTYLLIVGTHLTIEIDDDHRWIRVIECGYLYSWNVWGNSENSFPVLSRELMCKADDEFSCTR
jgi:hypothetical protein